ncbi:hypothetical protein GQ457_13G015240 [Hibiscus cannabinus]
MSLKNPIQMIQVLNDMVDVGCLMLATMTPELQKQHEDMVAYEMIQNFKEIYEGQARQERYETSKTLFQCKMIEGSPVVAHVIKMMGYIQMLEKMGFPLNDELAIDVVLQSLHDSFNQFVLNFNMNKINKTLPQLIVMLRTAKSNMKKNGSKSILMAREAKRKGKKVTKSKGVGKTKPKGKNALKPKGGISKEGKCFHSDKPEHWKGNCSIYLEEVNKSKAVRISTFGIYVIDVKFLTSTSWALHTTYNINTKSYPKNKFVNQNIDDFIEKLFGSRSSPAPSFCVLCLDTNNYKTLENTLTQFMAQTSAYMARTYQFIKKTYSLTERTEMKLQNQDASLKSLETQVGQISQVLNTRPMGGFPSDTQVAKGPIHDQCKAISRRSGRTLNTPTRNKQGEETVASLNATTVRDNPAEADAPAEAGEDQEVPKKPKERNPTVVAPHIKLQRTNTLEEMRPTPPFPQGLKKQKQEYNFKKLFDILKHFDTAAANEACLALMHNKVLTKRTDPGSFTIPFSIGNHYSGKALCDPGAIINLMSKSVFQKLGIGEAKPTTVMLQLADCSYIQQEGKIEDILVRVDRFIFPTEFLILDFEADEHAPIILGRPFLAIGRVLIDFENGELALRVNDQQASRKDHFPLPFIDQMLDRLAGKPFYRVLDGYLGYNQIIIAREDQSKTTFSCPYGTFAFRRMSFGLCNTPATFQRCMSVIFSDMNEDSLEIIMDDFSTFGDDFTSYLSNLEKVLTRYEETNLVLNWENDISWTMKGFYSAIKSPAVAWK